VRLTSVVGGRNRAYSTAVGKALLAGLPGALDRFDFPLERRTPNTIVNREALHAELEVTRARGYGVDDQENELGVNCLAIPVHLDGATAPSGAVSVSAVSFRCPLPELVDAVPAIREAITRHLGIAALGPAALR
jgi:DNA-binding IclR family transcriptional regulator